MCITTHTLLKMNYMLKAEAIYCVYCIVRKSAVCVCDLPLFDATCIGVACVGRGCCWEGALAGFFCVPPFAPKQTDMTSSLHHHTMPPDN